MLFSDEIRMTELDRFEIILVLGCVRSADPSRLSRLASDNYLLFFQLYQHK